MTSKPFRPFWYNLVHFRTFWYILVKCLRKYNKVLVILALISGLLFNVWAMNFQLATFLGRGMTDNSNGVMDIYADSDLRNYITQMEMKPEERQLLKDLGETIESNQDNSSYKFDIKHMPTRNADDNLLDLENYFKEEGSICQDCMALNARAEELYNQSRFNASLLRKRTCHGCFKYHFRYVIWGDQICRKNKVMVLILITSSPHNIIRRSILRDTWLSYANNASSIRYAFLLGDSSDTRLRKRVLVENTKYGDIVKFSFIDSYKNLTYKTIMGFKWASKHCPQARFVMKTDDDVFVNIPALLRMLHRRDVRVKTQRSIVGKCYRGFPIRHVTSKYYVSHHTYLRRMYPRFCSGTGYVTSMRVIRKINAISRNVPFFPLEDVYIALCMEALRFSMVYMSGFRLKVLTKQYNNCVYKGRSAITTHARVPNNVFILWKLRCGRRF